MIKKRQGPFPGGPAGLKSIAVNLQAPMMIAVSGEITTSRADIPIGSASVPAKVVDVYLSTHCRGTDASNLLELEADVKINGTSVLTTKPKIRSNSGEQATTIASGERTIAAVIDTANNTAHQGAMFTVDLALTRTSSPTKEIGSPVVIVDLEPILPS